MNTFKSFFYIITITFFAAVPTIALILWIIAFEKAITAIALKYFIFLFACPLVFGFFSFMFPIIRRITVNHFKRNETQKEVEFELQMEKFQIEQRTLNQALKLLSPKHQEELTTWRLKKLQETESNFSDKNLVEKSKRKEILEVKNDYE